MNKSESFARAQGSRETHVPRSLTVPDVDQIGVEQVVIADCTEQATQPLRKPTIRETRMSQVSCEHQSICGCLPRETMGSWPISRNSLNNTLCTITDELIHRYNTRSLDISVIRGKLWAGFSNSLAMTKGAESIISYCSRFWTRAVSD